MDDEFILSFEPDTLLTKLMEHSEPLKHTTEEQNRIEREEKDFFLVTSDNISEKETTPRKYNGKDEISEEREEPNIHNLKKRLTLHFPEFLTSSSTMSVDSPQLDINSLRPTYRQQVEETTLRTAVQNLHFGQQSMLTKFLSILMRQDEQLRILEKEIKILAELWQENEKKVTPLNQIPAASYYPLIISNKSHGSVLVDHADYIHRETYALGYRRSHHLPFYEGELLDSYKPECPGIFIQLQRGLIYVPLQELSLIARREFEHLYPDGLSEQQEIRRFTFLLFHKERNYCLPYYLRNVHEHRKLAHRIIWTSDLIKLLSVKWQQIRRTDPRALLIL